MKAVLRQRDYVLFQHLQNSCFPPGICRTIVVISTKEFMFSVALVNLFVSRIM